MRCVEIAAFGPPEGLRLVDRPTPAPAAGEVLVEVHAAGVNRPDVIQRYGSTRRPLARLTFRGWKWRASSGAWARAGPGGATAMAALLSGAYLPARGERVGVLLCGSNTDAVRF